ncbi:MAG: phosphomannomutase [Nitrospirae bacterium]|nr:phosphomannomutase [Nitrospirota bacterium]
MESFNNAEQCWKTILADVQGKKNLLSTIKQFALDNKGITKVVFGTSGWRGEIGSDYTFNNVRIVTAAIIELFKADDIEVMKAMGVKNFEEIKKRGVIVGHDNRFLGPDFAHDVMGLLHEAGIKVYYSAETTTPEFSTAILELNAACSINLTPSHNPANWAGFKFNPSDGGPAGPEITKVIENIANRMMNDGTIIDAPSDPVTENINPIELYKKFILKRGTIDLDKIKKFMAEQDVFICVDHVHGSTRTRPQSIIDDSPKIKYLRTEDDYLFGGIAPEPSAKNLTPAISALNASKAKFKLGVIMDPDGDRIRFTDGINDISMNHFGAMALHFLFKYKGIKGLLVKSVATSNFANAVARKLNIKINETMVGFKNFRPFLLPSSKNKAIVTFEESDGISAFNHTLEKDSMFGLLLAIEMMADTGKNIGDYLKDIREEFGYFYPDRSGISVDRSLVGAPLIQKLKAIGERLKVGASVNVGSNVKTVKEVITLDGTKVVFDDDSWLLIRPSGTEPKVRFYIETRSAEEKEIMFKTAEEITAKAIAS